MKRLKILLLFISLFVVRWYLLPSPLPSEWEPESSIRYSAAILSKPEYSDTQTIVRSGMWYIPIKGYTEIMPGSRISFEGKVEPKWMMGKVTQIKMVDAKMVVMDRSAGERTSPLQDIVLILGNWRERWVGTLQKTLPEPMASLAAGILLGVKGQMPQEFYEALVNTGTLHIVAASGYNVSIVAEVLMKAIGGLVSHGVGIGIGIVGIVLYVLISGGSASVVRAGIMGSLTLIAYYFGRPGEARRLLWVTGAVMLLYNPIYIVDIGFQLSFVATAGLLYIEPWICKCKSSEHSSTITQGSELWGWAQRFLSDYLYPTLAACIATLPVILYHFGRVSWMSPLVNIFVLPIVPLIMGMTMGILVGGRLVAWLTYPILAYMVWVIRWFG